MVPSNSTRKKKPDPDAATNLLNTKSRMEEELNVRNQINFATSHVDFMLVKDQYGKSRVHFLSPVILAPLERRTPKTSNRIVPLIEPDICNYMKMEIIPGGMLPLHKTEPSPQLITQLSMQVEQYERHYKEMQEQQSLLEIAEHNQGGY